MKKKECQVCNNLFTSQSNLKRHMRDVHHISDHGENDMGKQKYEGPSYSNPSTPRNVQFRNFENDMIEMEYENPPEYYNFTHPYSNRDLYNNRFYETFEPSPIEKMEKKLTIGDKIRILQGLGILRNFLQRICPSHFVIQQICSLKNLCYTQNSIQPLRDFFKKHNLMQLWPFK
jgi:hypothetical protein